ncbi:hypothetical protein [Thauera linaloolentis]|uniref:Uncharacterized protein n=1 Tax=Thauera linaloolentis (strain DSM 12138 / JCM 21573 / CCUG 41526 / CIP 105981 / IAM 15112 / NBRC 102519 / 47Lol) TaxID=1123367 RepID=N6Z142_THAL4|nr:hypothetical protein [Thauera linaloolentis]ENO88317.1 hypothetical protein C666_09040 [Thauera linaloolentis 47Lol = DSM 12138]MCM8564473.1 hypothetical protein [Thauera linaloolentis]
MAPPRIFDPQAFKGQGALITSRSLFNGMRKPPTDLSDRPLMVFLRWQSSPRIGMPVEPFKVWRRPAMPVEESALEFDTNSVPLPDGSVCTAVTLSRPVMSLTLEIRADSSGAAGHIVPLANGIGSSHWLAVLPYQLAPQGSNTIRFQAAYITGFLVLGRANVTACLGLPLGSADKIGDWKLVETVGLPVDQGQWSDLAHQSHGIKQGRVGAEMPAVDAAADRMSRGVNPFGWHQAFSSGDPAPAWSAPSAPALIHDAEMQLLPMLHKMMHLRAMDQAAYTQDVQINPPENLGGQHMSGEPGKAVIAPLTLLQMAVASDPLQAVMLGFGTGYVYEDLPPIVLGKMELFNEPGVSDWDYMVTGLWRPKGAGNGDEVEYAALIPRPRLAVPPPPPADLTADFLGHHQPVAPDAPWSAAVRLSWERLALDNLSRTASFAVGRADLAQPGQHADAVMEKRISAPGFLPIADAMNPNDLERTRQSASDGYFPIPNDPGSVNARYGVATQTIFGVWSPWITVPFAKDQPAPETVQFVDATLVPTDPGPPATVCPAELRLEFVLDWRARRVASAEFRGRLFAAATRHDEPSSGLGLMPVAMQTSLTGASKAVKVTFAGDVPSVAGGSIIALNEQGNAEVAPGPAQGDSRRYRLTVPGFALDFAATPHIGLVLWGRVQERLAPMRLGAWSREKLAYGSDPRARVTQVVPIVPLTSLPDAAGEGHAHLSWAAQPAAAGYVLYTSNEFTILDRTGQPRAAPQATLSERLVAMKAAFDAVPDRNAFTRVNDALLEVTSMDATIPRGSQAIHAWIVLPVSHGGIEGPWPSGARPSDALIVYAAPKIAEPAPPRIEARRVGQGDGFAARIRVETRPDAGAHPRRIRLYRTRVADAARTLDSMGPPLAEISASSGPWLTTPSDPAADGSIEVVTGTDTPPGSWKYVWYRAVALADSLPERGVLGGRSQASPAVPVLVPPAGPPPLSSLSLSWLGGGPGDVLAAFSSSVPTGETPLGPHSFEIEAMEQDRAEPVYRKRLALNQVETVAPAAPDSGVWRTGDGQYAFLLRRADVNHSASLTVRLIDPLGRATEQIAMIEAGAMLAPPIMSAIEKFSITGRGHFYTFTLENVRDDSVDGQPWRLRIVLTPPLARPARPPRRASSAWVFEAAVADIPLNPPAATHTVKRQRIGERLSISIFTRETLAQVEATVTAPDGATATRRKKG